MLAFRRHSLLRVGDERTRAPRVFPPGTVNRTGEMAAPLFIEGKNSHGRGPEEHPGRRLTGCSIARIFCRGARTGAEFFFANLVGCCPECCPEAIRGDQRVRFLSPNPLILLAPRAGLEPATKRLTAARSTN